MDSIWWGVWHGDEATGGWMRDADGRYFWYPGEQIARAQAEEMTRDTGSPHVARQFGGPMPEPAKDDHA